MSSTLLLRSAINVAARCSRNNIISLPKATLSSVALPSSYFNDDQYDIAWRSTPALAAATPNYSSMITSYNSITSYISSMIASTLSEDLTLTTVDKTARQLEDGEGAWDDIITMESPTSDSTLPEFSIWQISTLKRRKKMMNKHKLRKRRKKMRLKVRRQ